MKRFINLICFITLNLHLTACGSSGSGAAGDKTAAPVDPSTPAVQPSNPGAPTTASLTYYTLVENQHVDQGGHSYPVTVTGHCVVYTGNNYCWDDGWQTVAAISFETDFWGLCDNFNGTGQVGLCDGGNDPVTAPTLWTSTLTGSANVATPPHQPNDVFTSGIATPVTCTITGTIVDCVDFQIDTAQTPL